MKTNFKYLFIFTASILLGFASCNNDNDYLGVEEGIPTQMKLSITQSNTFSTKDDNANADEALFKKVDVFVYNALSGSLEKYVTLDGLADFNYEEAGNIYVGTTKISVTTGQKNIYVGVNLPASIAARIVEQGPSAAQAIANVDELTSATNGFAMFCVETIPATLVANSDDPANSVSAKMKRLVAKVAIQATSSLSLDINSGILSDLEFSIRHNNTKLFPLPFVDVSVTKDPNWTTQSPGVIRDADFYPAEGVESSYIGINPYTISDNKLLTVKYTPENTSEMQFGDELTYASIRAKFVPKQVIEYVNGTDAGGGFKLVDYAGGVATFYRVQGTSSSTYAVGGNGLQMAQDYATSQAISLANVKEYINGYCYYNVFLNSSKKYDVFRNDFYKVTVSKINGIGSNLYDNIPHAELETPTDIVINVEILDWNLVDTDTQLPGGR